ncbi:hypothetical protein EZV62_024491 [Acer yangbiense]|uniref:Protein kinase domain-containing protein n=1 Tax=Acer yangbiense TaxID=1000413 RepID=A0A5C7GWZ7_9ROSI|nr:hypothetical protein EZV62_024491 [Acer yangbiense]
MGENNKNGESNGQTENKNINAQTFTFRELASATKNFRQETLLGEGGFGRVYKGTLPANNQVVAVKQLDRNGLQGNKEFLVEAQPIFRDPKRFPDMADPLLNKQFPETGLNQAVAIAAMCLQEEPGARPLMSDVMTALSFLANSTDAIPAATPVVTPAPVPPSSEEKSENNGENDQEQEKSEVKNEDNDEDGSDYGDGECGGPEDANSATNSEVDSSDDYSDCSDYQETENVVDEENKDEHQKSIKKNSISGRKSSRKSCIKNASSGNNSQDGSSITTDRSISGSFDDSVKSSSKKSPLYSLSRKSSNKSSKGEESSFKSCKKPHSKSLSSKSHRRSKKTKDVPGTLSLKKPLDVRETQQALPDAQKAEIS